MVARIVVVYKDQIVISPYRLQKLPLFKKNVQ